MAVISPWFQNATSPPLTITVQDMSGNFPPNLTTATSTTLLIHDETEATADRDGGGTFTVTGPTTGGLSYQWVSTDVAEAGQYRLYVLVQYNSSPNNQYTYDLGNWTVEAI